MSSTRPATLRWQSSAPKTSARPSHATRCRGTRDQTGAWDHMGASRVVELGDGSRAREQMMAYEAPRHFAYRLDGLPGRGAPSFPVLQGQLRPTLPLAAISSTSWRSRRPTDRRPESRSARALTTHRQRARQGRSLRCGCRCAARNADRALRGRVRILGAPSQLQPKQDDPGGGPAFAQPSCVRRWSPRRRRSPARVGRPASGPAVLQQT